MYNDTFWGLGSVKILRTTVADPGFPVGGTPSRWGGANLRCGYFLAKMYAKMKELDPVGGACQWHPTRSANELEYLTIVEILYYNDERLQSCVLSVWELLIEWPLGEI